MTSKKNKKMEDDLKKMEDNLNFLENQNENLKKNGRRPPKKMKDEPINQNQPNWL